jgi:hypothetical protein
VLTRSINPLGRAVLPFWDGCSGHKALAATTARLSRRFAEVFGSDDMHFHDGRNEALCRWVLRRS